MVQQVTKFITLQLSVINYMYVYGYMPIKLKDKLDLFTVQVMQGVQFSISDIPVHVCLEKSDSYSDLQRKMAEPLIPLQI